MDRQEQLHLYRSCVPVVDAWYRADGDEHVTDALVDALAEAEGVDATDIPPLYDVVDLDALARLFRHRDGATDAGSVFGFTYENWNVFVRADGRIRVCDGDQTADPEPVFQGTTV